MSCYNSVPNRRYHGQYAAGGRPVRSISFDNRSSTGSTRCGPVGRMRRPTTRLRTLFRSRTQDQLSEPDTIHESGIFHTIRYPALDPSEFTLMPTSRGEGPRRSAQVQTVGCRVVHYALPRLTRIWLQLPSSVPPTRTFIFAIVYFMNISTDGGEILTNNRTGVHHGETFYPTRELSVRSVYEYRKYSIMSIHFSI